MWKLIKAKLTSQLGAWGLIASVASLSSSGTAATWLTDLPSAQATAKAENKTVLINFTGSDWCGWCIRLRKEVFSKPEFDSYANENLVLVEADFPQHKPQSATLRKANTGLANQFDIHGYPTLIVLNGDGKQLGKLDYQPGGPSAFISELSRISGRKPVASTPPSGKPGGPIDDSPPPPLFNGAPTAPPPQFNDVVLKGLSGSKNNRFAMINNKTLGAGESAVLKLGDREAKVKCLEIRENSVLVSVDDGAPREVKMRRGMKVE
jgi:thioredoxin-related protein